MGIRGLSFGCRSRHIACAAMAAVATTVLAMASAPVAAASKCHPGTHKFGSAQARTFCGRASAQVVLPGHTATIKQGSCKKTSAYFTINIGTVVLSPTAPNPPDYFGITVGKTLAGGTPAGHDGTYQGAAVAFVIKHKRYAVLPVSVTLTGNRTRGSFSGTLFGGGAVSGTFRCS
jgi:hypothetical protein